MNLGVIIKKPSATKKNTELDLIKGQLKMSQNQFHQMTKIFLVLIQQLATNAGLKPDPETSSPKKEVTPKKGCFER
jgi:hypothetical protein